MKCIKRLVLRLLKPSRSGALEVRRLSGHALRDLGLDPMAAELQRDALLWQKLAA
ncbi:hypothetical protein [Marinobacterium aestuariivivens]|uniref:DUF1127 domain-containing protein n=1 Tax=Marinobacterium aestuariivivens TaxID=1698799 RepID=A0ABW2A6D0_9GAMM